MNDGTGAKRAILAINRRLVEITGQDPAPLHCGPEAGDTDSLFVFGVVGAARTGRSTLLHALALDDALDPAGRRAGADHAPYAYVYRGDVRTFDARPAQRTAPARILAHDREELAGRVFLDLPDPAVEAGRPAAQAHPDSLSAWETELQGVLWVVTDATYADRRFFERLEGTFKDFENFYFVFNRIDHVLGRQGATHTIIRDELFQTLCDWLPGEPLRKDRVYAVCARDPDRHDLSRLRRDLFQRPPEDLRRGKSLNVRREVRMGARTISEHFRLDARIAELRALLDRMAAVVEREAGSALAEVQRAAGRLLRPLHAQVIELFEHRLRPWPLLSLLTDPAVYTAGALHRWQRVRRPGEASDYGDLERIVQATGLPERIAAVADRLRTEFPALFQAFAGSTPDRPVPPHEWAASLREFFESADREAVARLRTAAYPAPGPHRRWLSIVPAVWFPIVQPMLEIVLQPPAADGSSPGILFFLVQLLGVASLARTLGFVALFYLAAAALLYLSSLRRVQRLRVQEGPYRAGLRDHIARRLAAPYSRLLQTLEDHQRELAMAQQSLEPAEAAGSRN